MARRAMTAEVRGLLADMQEEKHQQRMAVKREKFLQRTKRQLQKAIDILDSAQAYFSDNFQSEFLDRDLKNSLECAMEDVDSAIDGD